MTRAPGGYLAFLDLTSCGVGCTVVLMLVVAAARPTASDTGSQPRCLVVRYAQTTVPQPELRIECKRPGEPGWARADQIAGAFQFSAPAEPGGGETFLVVYDPPEGEWAFRAYLVGFPKAHPIGPVTLEFWAEGDGVRWNPPDERPARWPGDSTAPARVTVLPSR